jgi:hypothetical protein
MKVNLKKIGAIVAGATILASSAAFAGLMFGSTTLVDANGAPVAKVVVGSQAAPSDGVAAALIAGKLVSEAYKSQTLTAQVSGTASCVPGNESGNATGTCSVSNKKAQLQITVPGATAAGTYTFNNLIGDYLNRRLIDREDNTDSSNANEGYQIGGSDTSDNANPFTDGTSGGSIGPTEEFMYRISGQQYSVFADQTLTDVDSGNTYVEHQDMWLKGNNRYDSDPKTVVGNVDFLAYTLKFDGPGSDQLGIPECTKADNLDFSVCKSTGVTTNIDDATETHRLKVWFLGEQWIVSEMTAPQNDPSSASGDGLTNENELVHGGEVKLAKEAVAGILNQGESLPADNLKFQLDDLEAHGDTTSAIISIQDANGNILKKDKVLPGETKDFNVNGKDYRFHVYKVAPGYTFGAKWADVAIFSEELKLADGQKLDSDNGHNNGWKVSLGWKNKDAQAGATAADGSDPENADTLRTVVLYSDSPEDISSSNDSRLQEGDYLQIVQDPTAWKLSYKGLDLTSNDTKSLKFELKTTDLTISDTSGPLVGPGSTRARCKILAPYVKVTSGDSGSIFEVTRTDGGGTISNNEFLVALNEGSHPNEISSSDTTDLHDTPFADAALCDVVQTGGNKVLSTVDVASALPGSDITSGAVFMKESSSSSNYGYEAYASPGLEIRYQKIGDGDNKFSPPYGGAIVLQRADNSAIGSDVADNDGFIGELLASSSQVGDFVSGSLWTGTNIPNMVFGISEKAGSDTSNQFVDYYMFGISGTSTGTVGDASFDIDNQVVGATGTLSFDSSNTKVLYGHATSQGATANNPYYCTSASAVCTGSVFVKSGPVDSGLELVDDGHVTERGSSFRSRDKSTVTFNMAQKLAHAQWFLAPTSTNTSSADTSIVTLGEGESTTISGVTVKVLQITEDVGACSAGAGAVSCTADMSGVSAVIMPNNAASVTVAMPYTGDYGNLVILDSDAVGVNTLISVGGDKVNSVTADLLQGSAVDWTATPKVVREVVQGSKIVVAGKEASDTLSAAQDFISQVKHV